MNIDLTLLGTKVRRYREQFLATVADVAQSTGLPLEKLEAIERAQQTPTGDDILILSDYFRCDYKFFLSAEHVGPFEHTEAIFARAGSRLTRSDRWAVQEFLYFCENEEHLRSELAHSRRPTFELDTSQSPADKRAAELAKGLRRHLGYEPQQVSIDVFADLRRAGFKVFRRALESTGLLGLFVRDPLAGPCMLVNCALDLRVQRVAAAHIAGQALADRQHDFLVSFNDRAATPFEPPPASFASHYLAPRDFLTRISSGGWTPRVVTMWSDKLCVPRGLFVAALVDAGSVLPHESAGLRAPVGAHDEDEDPELGTGIPRASRLFRIGLVARGLSTHYVRLCFDAYAEGIVSEGRLAELLLVSGSDVDRIAASMGQGAGGAMLGGNDDDDAD